MIIFGGDPIIDRYYYMFLDEEELESEGGGADCAIKTAGAGGAGSSLERCADDGSLSA